MTSLLSTKQQQDAHGKTMTHENLTEPISGQFRSSPFYVALGSLPIGGLSAVALTWLAYAVLPKEAADTLVPQLQAASLATGALGSVGGIGGMVKRGLDITAGKIAAQLPQKAPETINAGGNVSLETASNPVMGNPRTEDEPEKVGLETNLQSSSDVDF